MLTCSHLNGSDISSLLDPKNTTAISIYFPVTNINDESRILSCDENVQQYLIQTFGNFTLEEEMSGDVCYTSCSITVVRRCSAAIVYLQRVLFLGFESSFHKISLACGSVEVKCCIEDLPQTCFPSSTLSSTHSVATTTADNGKQ